MFKLRKIYFSLLTTLAVCLVISISAADLFAQKKDESKNHIEIPLEKGARKNGFELPVKDGVTYFEAKNVEDPKTKKKVKGPAKIQYRCKGNKKNKQMNIFFANGNSLLVKAPCDKANDPQPFLRMQFVICLVGIFPSRN